MSWVLAFLLILILIILALWVGLKNGATWKSRVTGWFLLALPVPIYMLMTGYFTTYYQHIRDCSADGGLRVLVRPESADRVQIHRENPLSSGEFGAKGLLYDNFPKLKSVVAKADIRGNIEEPGIFYVFTVESTNDSKWFNDWSFHKMPILELSDNIYTLSEYTEINKRFSKSEWRLTKNNKLYAKFTDYRHVWTGIQYPDSVPSWSCYDLLSDEYTLEEYIAPTKILIKLILK